MRFFAAALLIACLAAAPREYAVRWQPQRFADCNAAYLYAADHPTVGRYTYRLSAQFVHTTIARAPGLGYRGTAHIRYALVPRDSAMELPLWSWPNVTGEQRKRLRAFVWALTNHELGHKEIAERALRDRGSTLTVVGPSAEAVKTTLQTALSNQLHAMHVQLLQTENLYDRVTDHGVRQSEGPLYGFRGGADVVFSCR